MGILTVLQDLPNLIHPKQQCHIESIQRIGSLPVVESVAAIYEKIKDSNFLVRWGLKPAEMSIWLALGPTKTIVALFPITVYAMDSIVCASLDVIEKNIPVVTYPPDLVYNITKDYVTSTFVSPVLKRADSVKQISLTVANRSGELASTQLNNAIDVAEKYMDIYLPDTSDTPEDGDSKKVKTLNNMNRFSRKLHRRITRRTIAEAQALKQQGVETIHCLIYLADLLATDPKTFMEKARIMWDQLSEEEPENQIPPANIDQLISMLTRESARAFVHLVNYITDEALYFTDYALYIGHTALLDLIYWADYMIKVLHLQFIPEALRVDYQEVYNFYANILERMLAFIRQLNPDSNHPVLNRPTLFSQQTEETSHTQSKSQSEEPSCSDTSQVESTSCGAQEN